MLMAAVTQIFESGAELLGQGVLVDWSDGAVQLQKWQEQECVVSTVSM